MIAILDNSVLATFMDSGQMDLLDKSRIVFRFFLIPEKVKAEFLNVPPQFLATRQRFADSISIDYGFYRLCTTFDEIVLGILQTTKGIHEGEAQAIAQAQSVMSFYFLLTMKIAKTPLMKDSPHLRTMGTPTLVALLDVAGFLPNAVAVWQTIHQNHGFTYPQLKDAVKNAFLLLGIGHEKKLWQEKTSWKRIFGKPPKKKRLL
ncbi:MAG: hypothetical protein IPM82_11585 [Saprospiraceae bacterium]|nr:hypothetical protein [Saprospiraceae bacterium]